MVGGLGYLSESFPCFHSFHSGIWLVCDISSFLTVFTRVLVITQTGVDGVFWGSHRVFLLFSLFSLGSRDGLGGGSTICQRVFSMYSLLSSVFIVSLLSLRGGFLWGVKEKGYEKKRRFH